MDKVRSLGAANRPELEQAFLRVVLVTLIYIYVLWVILRDGNVDRHDAEFAVVGAGFVVLAILLLVRIIYSINGSNARKYLGILCDNAATTYCLIQMDEGGAFVLGVYLFVAFGNGFRFGRSYLYASQVLSLIGFGLVLWFSPFWSQHRMVGLGFLVALFILPLYVAVLTQRITEAKKKADEANQAKGRFLANVSHEMRTPLNGVIAMADVLRETRLNESQHDIVETLTTSAHLLLTQIEDVLDMAKIEAGRITMELRPFDLGKLLTNTIKVMAPQARYKGIELTTEIDPTAEQCFVGDSHYIRQVLLNLMSNAIKFTERGRVVVRVFPAGEFGSNGRLRFEVIDTGIGIATDKLASIFEPFTQADDSITRVYGGTGLGTTIARHLVLLMGGEIGLQSKIGVGSTFWFELPLSVAEAQQADALENFASQREPAGILRARDFSNIQKLRDTRILVAEDNSTNQKVARLILESGGHNVSIVENGEQALDALEQGGFDLALFDLSMPIVSGLEALKMYRFTCSNPIPILILSANVTTDAISECQRAGAAEFIPKPLRASVVLDAIDRHLERKNTHTSIPNKKLIERPQLSVVDVPDVDERVLNELSRISNDKTFMPRLLAGFSADGRRLLTEITRALNNEDYQAVRDAAHALKGGAASVGAMQLVQCATRLEKLSAESLMLRRSQLIEDLEGALTRSIERLDRYVDQKDHNQFASPSHLG